MPLLGPKQKCSACENDVTDVWEKTDNGDILCNKCYEMRKVTEATDPSVSYTVRVPFQDGSSKPSKSMDPNCIADNISLRENRLKGPGVNGLTIRQNAANKESFESKCSVRKSSRIKPLKGKSQTAIKPQATKGRSRRVIFKRKPLKAPSVPASIITSNYIFYKGLYWQVGDIVSVVDQDDGSLYYAQLRGFMQDAFNEKSAVITWLIPTSLSPTTEFDASTYVLGPEEDIPRKLEYFEFVCHASSDYFKSWNAPYDVCASSAEPGFIWTRRNAEINPMFGSLTEPDELDDSRVPINSKSIKLKDSKVKFKNASKMLLSNREKKLK